MNFACMKILQKFYLKLSLIISWNLGKTQVVNVFLLFMAPLRTKIKILQQCGHIRGKIYSMGSKMGVAL